MVTATTESYTLSLHDALPISQRRYLRGGWPFPEQVTQRPGREVFAGRHVHQGVGTPGIGTRQLQGAPRSEEHTSELQSHSDLVCRLLLEKKKTTNEGLQCLGL